MTQEHNSASPERFYSADTYRQFEDLLDMAFAETGYQGIDPAAKDWVAYQEKMLGHRRERDSWSRGQYCLGVDIASTPCPESLLGLASEVAALNAALIEKAGGLLGDTAEKFVLLWPDASPRERIEMLDVMSKEYGLHCLAYKQELARSGASRDNLAAFMVDYLSFPDVESLGCLELSLHMLAFAKKVGADHAAYNRIVSPSTASLKRANRLSDQLRRGMADLGYSSYPEAIDKFINTASNSTQRIKHLEATFHMAVLIDVGEGQWHRWDPYSTTRPGPGDYIEDSLVLGSAIEVSRAEWLDNPGFSRLAYMGEANDYLESQLSAKLDFAIVLSLSIQEYIESEHPNGLEAWEFEDFIRHIFNEYYYDNGEDMTLKADFEPIYREWVRESMYVKGRLAVGRSTPSSNPKFVAERTRVLVSLPVTQCLKDIREFCNNASEDPSPIVEVVNPDFMPAIAALNNLRIARKDVNNDVVRVLEDLSNSQVLWREARQASGWAPCGSQSNTTNVLMQLPPHLLHELVGQTRAQNPTK